MVQPTNHMWWSECSLYTCFFWNVNAQPSDEITTAGLVSVCVQVVYGFMMLWVVLRCLSLLLLLHVGVHNPKTKLTSTEKPYTTSKNTNNFSQRCQHQTSVSTQNRTFSAHSLASLGCGRMNVYSTRSNQMLHHMEDRACRASIEVQTGVAIFVSPVDLCIHVVARALLSEPLWEDMPRCDGSASGCARSG